MSTCWTTQRRDTNDFTWRLLTITLQLSSLIEIDPSRGDLSSNRNLDSGLKDNLSASLSSILKGNPSDRNSSWDRDNRRKNCRKDRWSASLPNRKGNRSHWGTSRNWNCDWEDCWSSGLSLSWKINWSDWSTGWDWDCCRKDCWSASLGYCRESHQSRTLNHWGAHRSIENRLKSGLSSDHSREDRREDSLSASLDLKNCGQDRLRLKNRRSPSISLSVEGNISSNDNLKKHLHISVGPNVPQVIISLIPSKAHIPVKYITGQHNSRIKLHLKQWVTTVKSNDAGVTCPNSDQRGGEQR